MVASRRLRDRLAIAGVIVGAVVTAGTLACNSLIGLSDFTVVDDAGADARADAADGSADAPVDAAILAPEGSLPAVWPDKKMPDSTQGASTKPDYEIDVRQTITFDKITTRTWMHADFDGITTFEAARKKCEEQKLQGAEWRLPSRIELVSLLDTSRTTGTQIDPSAFPGARRGTYWTASPVRPLTNPVTFWSVDFTEGNVKIGAASFVRCVKGRG